MRYLPIALRLVQSVLVAIIASRVWLRFHETHMGEGILVLLLMIISITIAGVLGAEDNE